MTEAASISVVATCFDIIEQLALNGAPIGVSEVARRMAIGRPRVFRHLRTLLQLGYVAQDPATEKYMLTPRLFHVGHAAAGSNDLLAAARRVLPELAERVKLTASVAQIEPLGMRVLDIIRYRASIEIAATPGALFDFHSSAQGKVALAFAPGLIDSAVRAAGVIVDMVMLRREIDQVRQRGWAASAGEILVGVNALAAPVFDAGGALTGTIAIMGSAQLLTDDPPPEMISAAVSAARRISEQLGHKGSDFTP
ncbi:MAG TPA: IclR family transcriptional regulator [Sphingomonas sp.]|nr:IclR family transcriptional regulator [Sphingomonas sp.]